MKLIIDFISNFGELPKKSTDKLLSLISLKSFKKNHVLAKIGEMPVNFFILKKGIVRSYYTDEKGKEYIRNIFTPVKTTGALGALISGKPSRLYYDCLSDCEAYVINFKDFKKLANSDKHISNLYSKVLEIIFLLLESKIYDLSVLNATERYLKLKRQIPDIENLIPQYHIASYLNITPVQLSRIRKEIYSK